MIFFHLLAGAQNLILSAKHSIFVIMAMANQGTSTSVRNELIFSYNTTENGADEVVDLEIILFGPKTVESHGSNSAKRRRQKSMPSLESSKSNESSKTVDSHATGVQPTKITSASPLEQASDKKGVDADDMQGPSPEPDGNLLEQMERTYESQTGSVAPAPVNDDLSIDYMDYF